MTRRASRGGRWPLRRSTAGVRGRKRVLNGRRDCKGCEHDFEYHEDTVGADDVINGTYTERWLECMHCGAQRGASYEDAPSYDYEDF